MKDGFIKVAAGSIRTTIADTLANAEEIKARIKEADQAGVNLLVLPELAVTGYSCGDLFYSEVLQRGALQALSDICRFTRGKYPLVILGLPILHRGKLYNCAAAVLDGRVLAFVPKTHLPNYSEFYELRQFTSGVDMDDGEILFDGHAVPFGTDILLRHISMEEYCIGIELCEDLWAPCPPSEFLCRSGAVVIANPSASDEIIGKADYRRLLVTATSARLLCGYVYANAGPFESTQDVVFSQHHLIAENGTLLSENPPFGGATLTVTELDLRRLTGERHRETTFSLYPESACREVSFSQALRPTALTRPIAKNPFVPAESSQLSERPRPFCRSKPRACVSGLNTPMPRRPW